MQSNTPLPIEFYLVDFPISDMTSQFKVAESPSWSGQVPSQSVTPQLQVQVEVTEIPAFEFGCASVVEFVARALRVITIHSNRLFQ